MVVLLCNISTPLFDLRFSQNDQTTFSKWVDKFPKIGYNNINP